jgi:4-hydroxybenzoyl-CoA reductase subunit beta
MDVLPDFDLIRPRSVDEVLEARAARSGTRLLGGGTDLIVNIRRGIGDDPSALIDMNGVEELKFIECDDSTLTIGASVSIADVAADPAVRERFPVVAQAAASIAGPTHRHMGTVGGNLCLDTRCQFYNQSEWWRTANDFCLKYEGVKCHVAPRSRVCFATFSGDLAPALLVCEGEVEIAGSHGRRTIPLAGLYTGDGQYFLSLEADEFVISVRARRTPELVSAYDKMRVRRSIDYPIAGAAVALEPDGERLRDLRVAFTGTNPRPVLLEGTADLCGRPVDEAFFGALGNLVRDQVMAMKTTFTPGHYRRRVAGVLARRLVQSLLAA